MKSIQVDGDVYAYLVAHGMGAGQSASEVLRRTLFRAIDIDDDLYAYLMSLTSESDGTANAVLRRELKIQENSAPAAPTSRIEFHIPIGTGPGPWNTRDHAVMGVVGQTLRIYNDDRVNHRLHTNGVPFQHPAAGTPPGTFSDFVLHDAFDLDTNPGLYDHDFGPSARFWISVRAAA